MKTVILKEANGREIYINPKYVVSIQECELDNVCIVRTVRGERLIRGNAHTVASILETERTRPDRFVSYKDWESGDDD